MEDRRFEELLEQALLARRDQVPPVDPFVAGVFAATAAPARPRVQRWLNVLLSGPALAIIGFIVVGLWSFWHQDRILALLGGTAGGTRLIERLGDLFTLNVSGAGALFSSVPGGETAVLTAVYSVLTLTILALTGIMTMRFVRN